jgi:dipeptidyl aminopeptidase/acylaminoacyl peptidase
MRSSISLSAALGMFLLAVALIVGGALFLIQAGFPAVRQWASRLTSSDASNDVVQPPRVVEKNQPRPGLELLQARLGFQTVWTGSTYQPLLDPPQKVAEARLIKYPAALGENLAYVSRERKDGVRLPAVVWAHSNFGGISRDDWDQARPFHDAGFVVMVPSFRGENNNPGRFEMFYGEVNDLLAAIDYIAASPSVDPERVYVVGANMGGTLALLAAVSSPSRARAFTSISGLADVEEFARITQGFGFKNASFPYNPSRPLESRLRSAIPFVGAIERPTFHFGPTLDHLESRQAERMRQRAVGAGVPFRSFPLPLEPAGLVDPVVRLLARKFADDAQNPVSRIEFSPDDLSRLGTK